MAVVYINNQGETRSLTAAKRIEQILSWTENVSALFAIYIPWVNSWQADLLSQDLCWIWKSFLRHGS